MAGMYTGRYTYPAYREGIYRDVHLPGIQGGHIQGGIPTYAQRPLRLLRMEEDLCAEASRSP